jgi:hypothetical protein
MTPDDITRDMLATQTTNTITTPSAVIVVSSIISRSKHRNAGPTRRFTTEGE